MPFELDGKLFVDELKDLCNKYEVYPFIEKFMADIPGVKLSGFGHDKKTGKILPIFQNVN